jgi:hypothetical protein
LNGGIQLDVRCIYCGKGESDGINLSESDIIPDGLTNQKIKNKNVCTKEHNNDFSGLFEAKVIEELSFLRNHLNIKGKSNKYAAYEATFVINGRKYIHKKITSNSSPFGKNPIKDESEQAILGPIEKLALMNGFQELNVEYIDLNSVYIEKQVSLDLAIFSSFEMQRLIAKMAYEWHCKLEGINDRFEDFHDIIDFISTGTGNKGILTVITNDEFYNILKDQYEFGSHGLIRVSTKNALYVYMSFWGICIYRVKLCDLKEQKDSYFASQEFQLVGKGSVVKYDDLQALFADIINISNSPSQNYFYRIKMMQVLRIVSTLHEDVVVSTDNEKLTELLLKNMDEILSTSILHTHELKRFVNEYNLTNGINLNVDNDEKWFWFNLFCVYTCGKELSNNTTIDDIVKLMLQKIGVRNSVTITDELLVSIRNQVLDDKESITSIMLGANTIMNL